ncbi:hypothetical protein EVAR_79984_1 [Eumeta japonica]|nr:hypothetical protein EVAR_79984_1 [Eumeta japonica]
MGGMNGELATIHEHEPMLFNTSVDSSSDSQERPSDTSQETLESSVQSPAAADEGPSSTSSARSTVSEEPAPAEGLHCLGLDQLAKLLVDAKTQKSVRI